MPAQKNQDIGKAFNLLQVMSQDQKKRLAYEARQAEIMDQRTRILEAMRQGEEIGIKKGEEIGIDKGVKQVAQSMLDIGMPVDQISTLTGLTPQQISAIPLHHQPGDELADNEKSGY